MKSSKQYINRDLSWLEFNQRVLDEAINPDVPLLERLKFLAISASNLNEFYMVRVGGLRAMVDAGVSSPDPSGITPADQVKAISERTHQMVTQQYDIYRNELEPALRDQGVRRLLAADLSSSQLVFIERMFNESIYPVITPTAIHPDREFPWLRNLSLHLVIRLSPASGKKQNRYAMIPIELGLHRFIRFPANHSVQYILVEDLIRMYIHRVFPGERILECIPIRITRNADMRVREEVAPDLVTGMEEVLAARRTSRCVRIEIDAGVTATLLKWVIQRLGARGSDVHRISGPIDLAAYMELSVTTGFDALMYDVWTPQSSPDVDPSVSMFEIISRRTVLLNHPYESFDPVVRFVEEAADDPGVLAIKQILYRASRDSSIVEALVRAAQNGKYVTVIVELKARFDEARNIEWARALEQAGAQVIYGIKGLKTHAKVCIVLRRESGQIRKYMHFGTGNYNESTAKLYSDISYLTCDESLGAEASQFFNTITGYSQPQRYHVLEAAPFGLRDRLLELIESEIERKRQGQKAFIMAKMNSLVDSKLIDALYRASKAGINIQLNIRGICCLRPGVRNVSEHITVTSIVDRFLEHSRIICFRHGGEPRVFISSADWMPRNLDRRIELLIPVEDPSSRDRLMQILETYFRDTVKARVLQPDGTYVSAEAMGRKKKVRCQQALQEQAVEALRDAQQIHPTVFEPHRPPSSQS